MLSAGMFSGLSSLTGHLLTLYKLRQDGSYFEQQSFLQSLREEETEKAQQYALELDTQASHNRAMEATLANSFEIERDWRQAQIGVQVKALEDRLDREIKEAPFSCSPGEFYSLASEVTRDGSVPALLIAPFFREDLNPEDNDSGPHSFRVAVRRAWVQAQWSQDLASLDGIISRPLRNTDLDILILQRALRDLPVVLVYGTVQSNLRVWPHLCAWNLVDSPELRSVQVNFPALQLPVPENDAEVPDSRLLAFEDELGESTAVTAGVLAEWFHLVRSGRIPRLHNLLPDTMGAEKRVIAAGMAACYEIALERGRIDQLTVRIGQASVCLEAGLDQYAYSFALQALGLVDSSEVELHLSQISQVRQLVSLFTQMGRPIETDRARRVLEPLAHRTTLHILGWGS